MTYIKFVCNAINSFEAGKPIYTYNIAKELAAEYNLSLSQSAGAVSVALKRIMDEGFVPALRFYQKGIYYLTAVTPFGEIKINKEQLIADKYLLPDNGYETGFSTLHRLGLTSQLPVKRCIATNKASDCARVDKKLGIIIRPPKTKITRKNKIYLQFLDALDLIDKAPVDAENPYTILAEYINRNGLKYELLLSLADKHYNKNTVIQLAHTASEGGFYETSSGH